MSGNNVMFRTQSVVSEAQWQAMHAARIREVQERLTMQPSLEEQRMADERVRNLLREGAL